jgi:elongation of very long chain fatty acids protein 7
MHHLPLMGNPLQLFMIITGWLYFVLRIGPRYMADRKSMALNNLIQVLNIAQIAINLFLTYEASV